MSDSLRLLRTNEQIARFFEQIAHFLVCLQKMSDSLKNFLPFFKVFKNAKGSLISFERSEQIAQVDQDK